MPESRSLLDIYSRFFLFPKHNKIPILVELRKVNFSSETILKYIERQVAPHGLLLDEVAMQHGLKAGIFALILDGFDEVPEGDRARAEREILGVSADYPKNIIVVSSRPDRDRFVSWHNFPEFSVCPLELHQLRSLISRIKYDEEDKATFLKRIDGGLYQTHKSLLSNPLLASMMLLTFREFQDIPSKMHVFYGTAFDVLYRKHDATKSDYTRDYRSNLEQDEFKKLFMTFCFYSYLDDRYSFDRVQVSHYISAAANQEDISVDPEKYYFDLVRNMCILQEEGDEINFIHRSFQEYFSALFFSRKTIQENFEYIDEMVESGQKFSCINMFVDIDKQEFERKYFIQKLSVFCDKISAVHKPVDLVYIFYPLFLVGKEPQNRYKFYGSQIIPGNPVVHILSSHYGLDLDGWKKLTKSNWTDKIPRKFSEIPEREIRPIGPEEMPLYLIKALGLDAYSEIMKNRISAIRDEIKFEHDRKKMARGTLRRKSS